MLGGELPAPRAVRSGSAASRPSRAIRKVRAAAARHRSQRQKSTGRVEDFDPVGPEQGWTSRPVARSVGRRPGREGANHDPLRLGISFGAGAGRLARERKLKARRRWACPVGEIPEDDPERRREGDPLEDTESG